MNLLIVTQKVDRTDPILGFFHRWIAEFAKHCETVTVIGQSVGMYDLPPNVRVLSLGKERQQPRFFQVLRFWFLLLRHARAYDAVFVHMTPIWVVLGWKVWFLLCKPIYLWYEARGGGLPLRLALLCVRKVFSASAGGMPVRTRKSVIVGHGIETERFAPGSAPRDPTLLVTVGRITAAKRILVILHALAALPNPFHLIIVGVPVTTDDRATLTTVQDTIHHLHLNDRVTMQTLPNVALPLLLQRAILFLHASETALDKAVLEAMACGCVVISCAEAFRYILPANLCTSPEKMAAVIQWFCAIPHTEQEHLRRALRRTVVEYHSLPRLVARLARDISPL